MKRAAIATVAALAAWGVPDARADLLRLENGRTMHGQVDRAFVDPEALRITLYSTGGTVRVRWEHLIAEDRDQWQVDLGLRESEETQQLTVDALKLYLVNVTQPVVGVVLNPEALQGGASAEVKVLSQGKEYAYPRGMIAKTEPTRVDLLLVYTPLQAYERKRDEIGPNNGPSHFDLAEYARLVGAYDEAKEHYLKAKDDEIWKETAKGRLVDSRLTTLEILIKNRSLQTEINRIKVALIAASAQQSQFTRAARAYLEARDLMVKLQEAVPDAKVQKELRLPELAIKVEAERRKFYEAKMPLEVYRRVKNAMWDKAKEQKARDIPIGESPEVKAALKAQGTFEGAKQYATRQVAEDLWNGLLKDVGASEELAAFQARLESGESTAPREVKPLTAEEKVRMKRLLAAERQLKQEVQEFWKNRNKNSFNVSSYGYGTFIVTGTTLKLTRKSGGTGGQGGRGGNRNQGNQQQAVDVVKTADQWWEDPTTTTKEKQDWLLSWCAEHAGIFEKFRTWDEPCDACSGLGYRKTSVAATGEEEASRCTLCNGAKVMRKIKWR